MGESRARVTECERQVPPPDEPLPELCLLWALRQAWAALPHQGLLFPKTFYHFRTLHWSVHRITWGQNLPAPPPSVYTASSAKQSSQVHLRQGGGRGAQSAPRSGLSLCLAQNNKAGMCARKGRCYGDFINNITLRIHVP